MEDLNTRRSNAKALSDLIDDAKAPSDHFGPASLIVRAMAETPSPDDSATERERIIEDTLAKFLGARSGISTKDETVRVVDPKKAETLAAQLDRISNTLVEDAYEMDREQDQQYAAI
ncbi:hypothetical protein [Segeticoccus rhizosphaerae]|uniref:hypothetical protein n=1 Tax=Segeticoccus rhizosphaerae TaxID=1104777 RepID=UPI00126570CF|nr:hypothetical protein [Segeticoccus rhizosphaerae]